MPWKKWYCNWYLHTQMATNEAFESQFWMFSLHLDQKIFLWNATNPNILKWQFLLQKSLLLPTVSHLNNNNRCVQAIIVSSVFCVFAGTLSSSRLCRWCSSPQPLVWVVCSLFWVCWSRSFREKTSRRSSCSDRSDFME